MRRARVLLLIPHLGGGGAERVTELLARSLSSTKYDLHLALVAQTPAALPQLPSSVTVHTLGAARIRSSLLRLLGTVRRLRPDVILSTMAHLNFTVLFLRPFFPRGTRILVRQNGTMSAMLGDLSFPGMTRTLYRALYPRANRILCQSAAMADDLHTHAGISSRLLTVVPNPIDIEAIRTRPSKSLVQPPGPHLISIGRFAPEKGTDLLLDAFALLRRNFPSATLSLAGRGAAENSLKTHAERLGLNGSVKFLGYLDSPADLYPNASAFVLPSRHEGMPNALLEAAAAGLPLVATPASGGVVDLLRGQPGAWLADAVSAQALADALTAAFQSTAPGTRFAHPWINAFSLDRATDAYEAVIDEVLDRGRV